MHGCLFKLNLSVYAEVGICMPIVTIKLNFQLENLRKTKEYGLPKHINKLKAAGIGFYSTVTRASGPRSSQLNKNLTLGF